MGSYKSNVFFLLEYKQYVHIKHNKNINLIRKNDMNTFVKTASYLIFVSKEFTTNIIILNNLYEVD